MTYCTENIYYYANEKQTLLVLKCDGYQKNKKIPQKVLRLLKNKHEQGGFRSFNEKHYYIIAEISLFVCLSILYIYIYIIIILYVILYRVQFVDGIDKINYIKKV